MKTNNSSSLRARALLWCGHSINDKTIAADSSRPRRNRTFEGLALDERLSAKDAVARCGLQVVDIDTGTRQRLRYEHTIEELYDVAVIPGVRQAEAVGFRA